MRSVTWPIGGKVGRHRGGLEKERQGAAAAAAAEEDWFTFDRGVGLPRGRVTLDDSLTSHGDATNHRTQKCVDGKSLQAMFRCACVCL